MCSFFSSRPENSKLNNYFSICDLTNKYNLKIFFEVRTFQIILEFSSALTLVALKTEIKKLDSELQIKIFFFIVRIRIL
jgi:hypothetical protein